MTGLQPLGGSCLNVFPGNAAAHLSDLIIIHGLTTKAAPRGLTQT